MKLLLSLMVAVMATAQDLGMLKLKRMQQL